ncbi:MAG: inositol monophosphatase [Thiotrichales bacterium]|nr:inositol monophosphatase [Thiotrichales bacterium]
MAPMLNIAVRAARAAGNIIQRQLDRVHDVPVNSKGQNDFVSEVDHQAEAIIIQTIRESYPEHAILAEESGKSGSSDAEDYLWIIDPLDGTTNYLHGFPQFAVSIALQHKGKLEQAVVFDPFKNEMFTAGRGNGAYLNDHRIRVSARKKLTGALIGTGFPFKEQARLDLYLDTFRDLFPMTSGIRRAGAAALDLAYVACGRMDGFWEFGLHSWDIAAGTLLIQEAGGIVTDMQGGTNHLRTGDVIGGNAAVYKLIQEQIAGTLKKHGYDKR